MIAVVAGGIIVFPALGLLFGLVLRGRLDRPRPAPGAPVRPARPARTRLSARAALACFVAGAAFLVLGPGRGAAGRRGGAAAGRRGARLPRRRAPHRRPHLTAGPTPDPRRLPAHALELSVPGAIMIGARGESVKYETVAEAYRDLEAATGRLALIDRLAELIRRRRTTCWPGSATCARA